MEKNGVWDGGTVAGKVFCCLVWLGSENLINTLAQNQKGKGCKTHE